MSGVEGHADVLVTSVFSAGWLASSVGTTLANKAVASASTGPLVLTAVQTSVCSAVSAVVVCFEGCRLDGDPGGDQYWVLLLWVLSMPFLFILSIALNLVALERAQITTWLALRNTEPAIVQCIERLVPSMRKPLGALTLAAHVGLVLGASLTQHRALHQGILLPGVGYCVVSVCVGACTRVWQAWLLRRLRAPRSVLILTNNVGGTLLLSAYIASCERARLRALVAPECPWAGILLSCVPATMLAFGTIHLQSRTTATHMAVLSCTAKILTIVFGLAIFRDIVDPVQLVGIVASVLSCALFGVAQHVRAPSQTVVVETTVETAPLISPRGPHGPLDDDASAKLGNR